MIVPNKNASTYTTNREPFKGSNTWGEWLTEKLYVVYSYGRHFPLFVWDEDIAMWFANDDKYSRSTSKHRTQLRPNTDKLECINTQQIRSLVSAGSVKEWTIEKARA